MIRLAGLYFAAVFAIGFALGTLRVVLLLPQLGARNAELMEIPLMLAAIYFISRNVASHCPTGKQALIIGFLALSMLLVAEVGLATLLFGKTPLEALFDKDPVSGTAYYLALVVFAIMPWLMRRRS